jgi:hypothetical protein
MKKRRMKGNESERMTNRQWEEGRLFGNTVSRCVTKKAANVIRRTCSDTGRHRCQHQSSGQSSSKTLGFEGLTSHYWGTTPLHWCSTQWTSSSRLTQTLCHFTASDFVPCSEHPWLSRALRNSIADWSIGNTCWVKLHVFVGVWRSSLAICTLVGKLS